MATQFTSNTLSGSYFDDFNINDNYHQILFNSGRPLQARELTQLQSMIYEELGRLGKNVFKEGAVVNPGGVSINDSLDWVTIASVNSGGSFSDIEVDTIFQHPASGVRAKVIDVKAADGDQFTVNTLYIQYIDGGNNVVGSDPTTFDNSQVLEGGGFNITTSSSNAVGKAVRFVSNEGDFFVLGRFVHTSSQTFYVSPYTAPASATLGFKVIQDVVTVNDTTALYDNSGGIVNTSSPGADRYRIRLELTSEDRVTSDETFVFLARVENSKIVEEVKPSEAYNQIENLLALRTKEESGNYIVNPFTVHLEDGVANDSSLEMVVSSGIAYINGYRVENPSPVKLIVPRPTETENITNDVVPVVYGNYFLADSGRGLPNLDYSTVNLYDAFGGTGNQLGTARVRAVMEDGVNVRVHVFDLNVDSAESLQNVKSIGGGTSDHFNLVLQGGKAVINDTTNNDLLFPTSRPRHESLSDVTLSKQVRYSITAVGTTVTLPQLPVGQSYVDDTLWIASTASNTFETGISATITNGGRDATITVGQSGAAYEVLAYVQKTASVRSKTLTTTTVTLSSQTDAVTGFTYFDLGVPDIFEVDSVRQTNSAGIDLSNIFTLDDGQRDNFYADGRLILEDGQTDPGTIYVKHRHFARGGSGDFYAASSYDVSYGDIPEHTLVDGTVVSLRDYLDFRPDKNAGTFTNIFGLPRVGTNITADINYYLPRADKLLITQEGDIQLLMGQQSSNPQFKPTPNNALELYKILLNGNTIDEEDLQVTPIEHKRYTMADIAKIESKLDRLEEFTTLSLLELETKLSNVLDSDGNVRIECGSQTDDFSDHSRTDTNNPDLSSSVDPESRLVRPKVHEDNIRLVVDNSSQNILKKGDNVYLNYTTEEWAAQQLASRFVKINPFGLVDNVGTLKLSPSSDEWKESYYEANKALAGSNKVDKVQAFLWNNWMWNWMGRTVEDVHFDYDKLTSSNPRIRQKEYLKVREKYASTYTSTPTRTANGRFVTRVASSDTLREVIGNRTIDVALIPWIRSRKIYFHAKGLKPNTKFTPFFDGENVSSWCREEATFVRWSDRTDDIANQYTQLKYSSHPDGSGELISDENGEIVGSFFIPNLRPYYYVERVGKKKKKKQYRLRFRAGIREFKLLDIDTNDWATASSKAFAYYTARGALWNNWGPIASTRNFSYTLPFGGYGNIGLPSVFDPKQLKSALDAVTAANIGILDPQLAGQYGPDTTSLNASALATLDANGDVSQVLSDYINVNQNQSAGAAINTVSLPQNPLAQTFKVDNQFGVTLTKIDLYFRAKDSGNLPVSIHIRPVVNGRPSSTEIVPDSHVYLNPGDVDAIGTDPQLSIIQSRPTTFEFDEPVYLQPWTEYAIVVTSQSTEYELFSAKTTETVYGSTTRRVTTQPAPGSLYLPQNGVFWIESKDQDIMFKLTRAKFDIGAGSLVLKNVPLSSLLLEENPIYTTNGSAEIYVKHPEHGHIVGDTARLDSASTVGGISAAVLNDVNGHSVTAIDVHGYKVNVGSNATSTAIGGGDDVLARRNAVFSVANPYLETIVPNFTSIDVSAKFTTGRSVSGSETRFTQDTIYQRVTPKQNIDFNGPRAIYDRTLEVSQLSSKASVYVKVDMKTSNDYVSPIIDLQRASLILANNVIDNPDVTPAIYAVSETEPYGGTAASKHISSPVMLEQSAVGIEAKLDVNLPSGSDIEFYYRTASADENIYDKRWILHEPLSTLPNDNDQTFREATFLPGGQSGTLKPFNQAQVKTVFKGTDASNVPGLKSMKVKYLAV